MKAPEEPLQGDLEAIEEGEKAFALGEARTLEEILSNVRYTGPLPPPSEDELLDTAAQEVRKF